MKKSFLMAALVAAVLAGTASVAGCQVHVHEHTFEEEWSSDATHHWHKATCEHADVVDGWAEHTFGEWTEGKKVCSVCGYEMSCTHSDGEWNDGKKTCSVCGEVIVCTHTEDGGTVTGATYVTKGKKIYNCTVCNTFLRDEYAYLDPIYAFTEAVKVLPSTYSGTNGTSSTYVEFGDFPQSEAAAEITYRPEPEENGYYVGSDGNYYAKVTVAKDNSEYKNGDVKYFKVEPIKWRVITTSYDYDGSEGSATAKLLLAEDILTANVPYYQYDDESNTRTVTTEEGTTVSEIYPNNYEYSQIRAYLNGLPYYNDSNEAVETYKDAGFLQTAFTAAARDLIKTTYVDNSAASTTDATGFFSQATKYKCGDTQDKIFLLSEKEVTTTDYGFKKFNVYKGDENGTTDSIRIRMTTAYARANNANQSTTTDFGGYWWLRSPHYYYNYCSRVVRIDGYAIDYYYALNASGGVVPALSISF